MNSKTKKYQNKKNRKRKGFQGKSQNKTELLNQEIERLKQEYTQIKASTIKTFEDFPLSKKTRKGLENGKYSEPTDIQRQSIGLALRGNDILGAAKTGSGKTLAFLLPVLEKLYVEKWNQMDGLGALIITPTRELAFQIFEVLRVIGKFHDFSAGLVIGGKQLKEESMKINSTNIIICTPGRLLQHMDETFNFNADNLHMLVLDEADRILDMGFKDTMNAIVQNLPPTRQTLLFSATQTKSVKDLARLSLKDPMYVSVHENAQHSTPTQLNQSYVICELHDKLNMLWSFIRNHLKCKTIVFMTSCKQVRYVYNAFKHMRPGVPVLCLHGAMQQLKRVGVYNSFKNQKHVVLFATDIAARGLDFPSVNWVLQLDCPDDANTYIHRAGRTARYEKNGESLLVLLPSEAESMVKQLRAKKIPVDEIEINREKLTSVEMKLQAFCASRVDMKEFAQRCFMSYLKAVFYMKDKTVFDVTKLDTDSYARSLGLVVVPRIRFLEKNKAKQKDPTATSRQKEKSYKSKQYESSDNASDAESDNETDKQLSDKISQKFANHVKATSDDSSENDSDEESENDDSDNENDEHNRLLKHKYALLKSSKLEHSSKSEFEALDFGGVDDDEDLLTVKRKPAADVTSSEDEEEKQDTTTKAKAKKKQSKAALTKKILNKNLKVNSKITFDEEGEKVVDLLKESQIDDIEVTTAGGIDIAKAKERMKQEDVIDKKLHSERLKKKRQERKEKEKKRRKPKEDNYEEMDAFVGSGSDDDDDDEADDGFNSEDYDRSGSEAGFQSGSDAEEESDAEGQPWGSRFQHGGEESDESADSDASDGPPTKKAKVQSRKKSDNIKQRANTKHAAYETGQNIQDDEMMALHLLSGGL